MPADPERQRALPDDPGVCPHCGDCAWRRNGTHPRHLPALGRLSGQRPRTFRELVVDLYVYSVSL